MSRTGRGSGSFADALRTIGVLGGFLIAAFFVGQVMTVRPDRPATTVKLADAVQGARSVARFDVVAPRRLPDGARATSARFTASAWHLGVVTADGKYIGLEQAPVQPATLIHDVAPRSRPSGSARVGGQVWSGRVESDGDRVYVRDMGESSVLVVSSADAGVVERYVESLASFTSSAPSGS